MEERGWQKSQTAKTEKSRGGIVSSAAETENWSVPIKLTVNGVEHAATVEPRTLLVYFLQQFPEVDKSQ
jgi:hypothetical protein